jgi:vacuolar-type H+-ATPase catalytic subunit A/Vma1
MSVFYSNSDPLLTSSAAYSLFNNGQQNPNVSMDTYAQLYKQQLMMEMQRQQQQQQEFAQDWLNELDKTMKNLDPTSANVLNENTEFATLNGQLQALIQSEIMNLVKVKINSNPNAIDNMKRQMDLMRTTSQKVQMEEKQNISDLNDYMKNYSHLTFDEYKRLKYEQPQQDIQEVVEATKTTKKAKNS